MPIEDKTVADLPAVSSLTGAETFYLLQGGVDKKATVDQLRVYARGDKGDQGDQGDPGPAASLEIGTVTASAPGSDAAATITGVAPNQVLGLTLPRGDVGPPGPPNSLAVGLVTTGAAGSSASATITGTPPSQILNLTIPRGDVGGPGPANSLTIGTVITGAAGSSAAATITGSAPNQTLDLTIPQGIQGIQGNPGSQGLPGGLSPAITITESKTLTSTDGSRLARLNIPGPIANSIAHLRLPTHAQDAIVVGTPFEFVRTGGGAVRFVPNAGVTLVSPVAADLVSDFSWGRLVKTGNNEWFLYGTTSAAPADGLAPPVWLDFSDLSSMRAERTGAAATTQITGAGQQFGSIRNKGTLGGWATVPLADSRRPFVRNVGSFWWAEFDGVDDYLVLSAPGLSLVNIEVYMGMRIRGWVSPQSGVLSFASAAHNASGTSDIFAANAMSFLINANDNTVTWRGGFNGVNVNQSTMIMNAAGIKPDFQSYHLRKQGDNATLFINDAIAATDTTSTNFGAMGGDLIIGARHANGVSQFGAFDMTELIINSSVAADPAPIRAFVEAQTYGTVPAFPAITNTTQLNAARTTLISEVFGGGGIPTATATQVLENPHPLSYPFTNLNTCHRLDMAGYPARPRLWTPNSPRNDIIVLLCQGHDVTYTGNGLAQFPLQGCLTRGIRAVTFALPNGPDTLTSGDVLEHETARSPLSEWAGPVSIVINTLLASWPSAQIYIAGISGGGFMATLCGAVDARIARTYDFVGSAPDYFYLNRDWEQRLPGITATFMDLYLLSACPGRRKKTIWYDNDPVAFNAALLATRPAWGATLATQAASIGSGDYDFVMATNNTHAFTSTITNNEFFAEFPP